MATEHQLEIGCPPERTLAAVGRAAEAWGADWQQGINGGSLHLPVAAGTRRGMTRGKLQVERSASGSAVRFVAEESIYYVQTSAVAILVLAAAGGLLTVAWPFFPALLPLAPLGAIVALSGWFLVISRLVTSTPDDFLRLVEELAKDEEQ